MQEQSPHLEDEYLSEPAPRFSPGQRALAAIATAAVIGGFGAFRVMNRPTVEQEVAATLSETGQSGEELMKQRLAQQQAQNQNVPPQDETRFIPVPQPESSPTPSEFLPYLPLRNPAPKRLIIVTDDFAINFPIVYTDVDRGIKNLGNNSAPYNDPPNNRQFESNADGSIGMDRGSDLGPLLSQYLETKQKVAPDEQTRLTFVTHRSSSDPEAGGNPLVNNEDVDPATYGEGLQVGDTFKTRFNATDGQKLDLVWTIVQHPDVVSEDGQTIGKSTDNSPSWLLEKDPEEYGNYADAITSIFRKDLVLPDGVEPIIEDTYAMPTTSHKGNGKLPQNGEIDGSKLFAVFVAVPTAVEIVDDKSSSDNSTAQVPEALSLPMPSLNDVENSVGITLSNLDLTKAA